MARRKRKWPVIVALVILVVVPVATGAAILHLLFSPTEMPDEGLETDFEVKQGERLDSIAERLHEEGLILDPLALKLAGFFGGGSKDIKAGKHILRFGVNAWEIYQLLKVSPKSEFIVITIPEGRDIFQIANILEKIGFGNRDDFLKIVHDPTPVKDILPEATSLEGFLYPDTYYLDPDCETADLVDKMLARCREILESEGLEKQFKEHGLELREGIVLASMIAKEAGNKEEMPIISSVFHNRLGIGMKLDCDPTFIYARKLDGSWDGKVRRSDRKFPSPYNTYINGGLPPGPVGNPGLASLRAAANPAVTEEKYLYFVAKNKKNAKEGHYFSATHKEHLRKSEKYFKSGDN